MNCKIIIPGLLPGLNEYISAERTNKHIAAKMKRQTEELVIYIARAKHIKFNQPVHITYRWIEKNRKRDKDNIAFAKKFVQDALVKAKVLENDGWQHITGFTDLFEVDPKNPRVEITIQEVQ